MGKASAVIEIPASPNAVWQLIGGFNSLPSWLSYILRSKLSEDGRVRHLVDFKGETIVERLEEFDNTARSYSYSIVVSPFPVSGYRSSLRVNLPLMEKGHGWNGWRPSLRILAWATSRLRKSFKESSKKVLRSWHFGSSLGMRLGGAIIGANELRFHCC
jgi:hypothetical protein